MDLPESLCPLVVLAPLMPESCQQGFSTWYILLQSGQLQRQGTFCRLYNDAQSQFLIFWQ